MNIIDSIIVHNFRCNYRINIYINSFIIVILLFNYILLYNQLLSVDIIVDRTHHPFPCFELIPHEEALCID